jgi:hypothetical protein
MFVGHLAVAFGAKRAAPRWNSIPATLAVEGVIFAGAVFAYATAFPARDASGRWPSGPATWIERHRVKEST